MITVDMMSDQAPGDDQLDGLASQIIRDKYAVGQEMKLHRMMLLNPTDPLTKANFDQYNTFIESVSASLTTAKTQCVLLRDCLAYEQASRLLQSISKFPAISSPIGFSAPPSFQAQIDAANAIVRGVSADVLALAKTRGKI